MTIFSWIGALFSDDARHNHNLYKTGKANRNEVRLTTVGWRPDPINGQDGYNHDPNGPSRNPNGEYYRVIRSKKRR
jgi:hypothetical protein